MAKRHAPWIIKVNPTLKGTELGCYDGEGNLIGLRKEGDPIPPATRMLMISPEFAEYLGVDTSKPGAVAVDLSKPPPDRKSDQP